MLWSMLNNIVINLLDGIVILEKKIGGNLMLNCYFISLIYEICVKMSWFDKWLQLQPWHTT